MLKSLNEQYITNIKGEKIAIVIPWKNFQKMNEDLHDLEVIAERKKEKNVSFSEMKNKFIK